MNLYIEHGKGDYRAKAAIPILQKFYAEELDGFKKAFNSAINSITSITKKDWYDDPVDFRPSISSKLSLIEFYQAITGENDTHKRGVRSSCR